MDPQVRRRVVSAPIFKTPQELQTEGPPAAFDPPSKDNESPLPRNFDFCIPNTARLANERPIDEKTYRRLLQYLYQLQVLLVLIWADMILLFIEHPLYTIYFFSKESSRDALHGLFGLVYNIWYGSRVQKCISFIKCSDCSARHIIETIEWWYSAWRWRVEEAGMFFITIWRKRIILLTGREQDGYIGTQTQTAIGHSVLVNRRLHISNKNSLHHVFRVLVAQLTK